MPAWLVLLLPFGLLGSKLVDVTDNRTESVLPPDAESTAGGRSRSSGRP